MGCPFSYCLTVETFRLYIHCMLRLRRNPESFVPRKQQLRPMQKSVVLLQNCIWALGKAVRDYLLYRDPYPPVRDRSVYPTHQAVECAVGYHGDCRTNQPLRYGMRAEGHMPYHRMPTVHAIQINSCC